MGIQKPEILAPAGSLSKLKTAFLYGADAVYIGGTEFGLRKAADNFSLREMAQGIAFAHEKGGKVYVVLNGFPHQEDMPRLVPYLHKLQDLGPDALIISDVGVAATANRETSIPIHVSTQASVMNWRHAAFWKALGAKRVIVGREVGIEECQQIIEKTGLEVESFIHGSMCTSNSGKCVISNYTAGRDSNRGGCIQSCRYDFDIINKDTKALEYQSPIMNSKDLLSVRLLPDFIRAGIQSLKIEGRMKSEMYVANTVANYRKAVDVIFEQLEKGAEQVEVDFDLLEERLMRISNRQFTTGSLEKRAFAQSLNYDFTGYQRTMTYVGMVKSVLSNGRCVVDVRENITIDDVLNLQTHDGDEVAVKIQDIVDMQGNQLDKAHPNKLVSLNLGQHVAPMMILRNVKDKALVKS